MAGRKVPDVVLTEGERAELVGLSGRRKTLESTPAGATHWSSRGMASASGISVSSVQRLWRAFGLQPHRAEGTQALH